MNGCCIIETRIIGNLQEIIQQKHLNFIPREWGLTLFLSEDNKHLIHKEMFDREIQVFILPNPFKEYQYNHLLTSVNFWQRLPYENVLIFQTDSELLKEGVERFIGFDFIGAPDIRKECRGMMNGGLSLRNVKKCMEVCDRFHYDNMQNEDWYFCRHLKNLPSFEVAEKFSIETYFKLGSLGTHAIDKWMSPEQCNEIRTQYR